MHPFMGAFFFIIRCLKMTKIDNFISLAEIDEQIQEIESSKGDLPSKIKNLETEKSELSKNIENLNEKLSEFSSEETALNRDKEDSNVKLAKFKDQLYLVKNNKEYDALNTEIDSVNENLTLLSNKLSIINTDKSNIEEDIKLNQVKIDEYSERLEKYNLQLKDSMNDNEKEHVQLKKERENLISDLDHSTLKNYNKMFNAKGFGMVSIAGDACSSCYTVLPTQLITEIKEKLDFKYCPSCNILLYFDE